MESIPVILHDDHGAWWAESPAIDGWSAAASSLEELRPLVEEGVRFALETDDVVVVPHLARESPAFAPLVFDFVGGIVLEGDAQLPGRAPDVHTSALAA